MSWLDYFFPPQCLRCDALSGADGGLCEACWPEIHFLSEPCCARCGIPFEFSAGAGALCGECLRASPPFVQARALFRYDEASKALILRFKYHDQTAFAKAYGRWMSAAAGELLDRSELIVPVPLHKRRLLMRRYNQAALLGQALSRHVRLPTVPDALVRKRHTEMQTGLSREQRAKNVKGAFSAHPKRAGALSGRSVLLVDDVYTTGATLAACTQALLQAGARDVYALTLARRV